MRFLYEYFIHCVKLLSKHLEVNSKYLRRIWLVTDVNFLFFSSVNNDLHTYVFATRVGCDVTYLGSTELNHVPYISGYLHDQFQ